MEPELGAKIVLGMLWYVVFLMAITFHEGAHALAAKWGGDPTAFQAGQVTLSPLPHMQREPFGTMLVPLISFYLQGWMIGWASAPYDPLWQQRHPRRAAWMALAGPAANAGLMILAGILIRFGMWMEFFEIPEYATFTRVVASADPGLGSALATFLSILFMLNLLLFAFNLLPVPPLDGSTGVTLLMSEEMSKKFTEFIHNPMFGMVGILIAWVIFGRIFPYIFKLALISLYWDAF